MNWIEEVTTKPSMSTRANMVREQITEIAEAHIRKMETQLQRWGANLDELVAKAETAGSAEVEVDYRKGIDDLKSKYQVAQAKFAEFKTAGSSTWGAFKSGVDRAWNDLEGAFRRLTN